MAAAMKEISMDAEAATVLSKPGGGFGGGNKASSQRLYSRGKSISSRFRQDFPEQQQRNASRRGLTVRHVCLA